jgi:hypothetical protein
MNMNILRMIYQLERHGGCKETVCITRGKHCIKIEQSGPLSKISSHEEVTTKNVKQYSNLLPTCLHII